MKVNEAVATGLLLLLKLTICCDGIIHQSSKTLFPQSVCERDMCHISPDSFWQLQEIISSNKIIILNGEISVDENNGFIDIRNVSNLTISGEEGGSLIECSTQSSFGFHLYNAKNVTLTRIRIKNCGFAIPYDMVQYLNSYYKNDSSEFPQLSPSTKTSLLIVASNNVLVSRAHIEYSPELALTVIDLPTAKNSEDHIIFMNDMQPNLRLTDCIISNSGEGSMLLFEKISVLVESTHILNSSMGIQLYKADVMMKNVDITDCMHSYLEKGYGLVRDRLTMTNSSLTICEHDLNISKSNVFFVSGQSNSFLTITQTSVYLTENSVVHFSIAAFLRLSHSTLQLNNSTLIFKGYTSKSGEKVIILYNSDFNVINGSSLIITNTTLRNESVFLCFNDSSIILSCGTLLIAENVCQFFSYLIESTNTTMILEKESFINLTQNSIYRYSYVFFQEGGLMDIYGSSLTITNNSVMGESYGLLYAESSLMVSGGKLLFEGNLCRNNSNIMVMFKTNTIMESGTSVISRHNEMYDHSSIIYTISTRSLEIKQSFLVITNNLMRSRSYGLTCKNSTFFLIGGLLLFRQNDCEACFLLYNLDTFAKFENQSLLNFTHNKVYEQSAIFLNVGVVLDISESSLMIKNNLLTNGSSAFWCQKSIIFLSAVVVLFNENHCERGNLILSMNTVTKIVKQSLVNFTHNIIQRDSYIIHSVSVSVNIYGSSLSIIKNLLTNGATGIGWFGCSILLAAGVVPVKENDCEKSNLIANFDTNLKLERQSFFNFTNNNINRESNIFLGMRVSLIMYESYLSINNNLVTNTSSGFVFVNCSIVLATGIVLIQENFCGIHGNVIANFGTNMKLERQSLLNFTHNKIYRDTFLFCHEEGILDIKESSLVFFNNQATSKSSALNCMKTNTTVDKGSFVIFTHNILQGNVGAPFYHAIGLWKMSSDSKLVVIDNKSDGRLLTFDRINASFDGKVRIANNNYSSFGAQNFISSVVWFTGSLEVVKNRGIDCGGIYAVDSDLFITDTASFSNNYALKGGALTFISSVMHVSPNASVDFTKNKAQLFGGAIHISDPRTRFIAHEGDDSHHYLVAISCSIQVLPDNFLESCQFFLLTFNQNKADIAGNAIYGGHTSACFPCGKDVESFCQSCPVPDGSELFHYNGVNDSSDLSNFTSDPTRVCFCENGIPDCYKLMNNVIAHPGEHFNISLVVVGYGLGTVPGSVVARGSEGKETHSEQELFWNKLEYSQEIRGTECQDVGYSVTSERDQELIVLGANRESLVRPLEEAQTVVDFALTREWKGRAVISSRLTNSIYVDFFYIPVFVEVDLLPCPIGFQLVRGRCVCHQLLLDNNIDTCFFSNSTALILRPVPYWIGLPSDTNASILVHPHCPFDYCQSEDMYINAAMFNLQCQYQRSGVLCGSCCEGLSMIFGSSECKICSNMHLGSVIMYFLVGVALVTMITLLNMTVSVGTLNGLILFANILQANRTTFLPSSTSAIVAFLSTFVAWLNLDLGIPICFFDGMTTYIKTWLQFTFPLYILTLVGVMIIASNYSTRVTRLLGTNAVSVLATLILLSYTKILRILITAFSFTALTGSQDYHSVVWLADGNIKYFEPKHAILFLVSFLVLLLLGIPYTITLTAAPWIQRSKFQSISSLYNGMKPLFDAYMGPYKDNCRYWTGMLLLVRVVLIVLFSSIANTNTLAGPQLNLFLLTLSSSALLALTAALKPYRNKLLNALEIMHLAILLIFSSSNLYISYTGAGTRCHTYLYIVLVGICFLVFLGICMGHVWYKIRKTCIGRRSQPPERGDGEYVPRRWQRARIRAMDDNEEEEEDVMITSAGATNTLSHRGRRDSLVELIAISDI